MPIKKDGHLSQHFVSDMRFRESEGHIEHRVWKLAMAVWYNVNHGVSYQDMATR